MMMTMRRTGQALAAALLLAAAPAFGGLPGLVPESAEVVAVLDLGALKSAGLMVPILNKVGEPKLQVLESLTGLKPDRDVDRIIAFGQMNDKEFGGAIIEGRFDQQKLIGLAKANDGYKEEEIAGVKVHAFADKNDGKTKYGVFVGNALVIYSGRDAAEESLKAHAAGQGAPADLDREQPEGAVLWARAVVRGDDCPLAKFQVAAVDAAVRVGEDGVKLDAIVESQSKEQREQTEAAIRGFVALGQLQQADEKLMRLAKAVTISTLDDKSVSVTLDVPKEVWDDVKIKMMSDDEAF